MEDALAEITSDIEIIEAESETQTVQFAESQRHSFSGGNFLINHAAPVDFPVSYEKDPEKQDLIFNLASEFIRDEIIKKTEPLEKHNNNQVSTALSLAGSINLLGISIPEILKGAALGEADLFRLIALMASGNSEPFLVAYQAQLTGIFIIKKYGTPAQQEKWLPDLIEGKKRIACGFMELTQNLNFLNIKTIATLSADQKSYVIKGEKSTVLNANKAQLLLVFAKIKGNGYSIFILDKKAKGIKIGKNIQENTHKPFFVQNVTFTNVEASVDLAIKLGPHKSGITRALASYKNLSQSAEIAGFMDVCSKTLLSYSKTEKHLGKPISQTDANKGLFADLTTAQFVLVSSINRITTSLDTLLEPAFNRYEEYIIETTLTGLFSQKWLDQTITAVYALMNAPEHPFLLFTRKRQQRLDEMSFYNSDKKDLQKLLMKVILEKVLADDLKIRGLFRTNLAFSQQDLPAFSGTLSAELHTLAQAKHCFAYLFNLAMVQFGKDITNQSQLTAFFSDILVDIYTLDSLLWQIRKQDQNDDRALLIAKIFSTDCVYSILNNAERIICSLLSDAELETAYQQLEIYRQEMLLKYDIIALKHQLAEEVYSLDNA